MFEHPSYLVGVVVMALLALVLIRIPLANAGRSERAGAARGDHVDMRPARHIPGSLEGADGSDAEIPPEEKLQRALALTETARKLSEAGLREAYPDAGEREIFLRLSQRQLGDELFQKVYGDEWRQFGSRMKSAR